MKQIGQIAIASMGLVLFTACASTSVSGPSPEATVKEITDVKAMVGDTANADSHMNTLSGLLTRAEEQMALTADKPTLNFAWTFAALSAADAMKAIPGQSDEAFAVAATKTLNYADKASTACLSGANSGVDGRQGNMCGMALAVRRLNDSAKAVQAFSTATNAGDMAGSIAASGGFKQQVSTNWVGYAEDAAQIALSDQDQTPFARMALQETCELQVAQGQAGLLRNPSMDEDVRNAKDAYWGAMASAASFLDISSSATICETEPDSRSCKRETEIRVAEICMGL